jgi:hypothetical protein
MIVPPMTGWGKKSPRDKFVVPGDGSMPNLEEFHGTLFGSWRKGWQSSPTIEVEFPEPGDLVVHVSRASRAILEVFVDEELALREESLNVRQTNVDKGFRIAIPAGRHAIRLQNAGQDWVRIGYLLLSNYRDSARYPDIEVYGVQSDTEALLWFHNRLNEWAYKALGIEPEPVANAKVTIRCPQEGTYQVEWWDTYQGKITKIEEKVSRDRVLRLDVPVVVKDVACKVRLR